MGILSFQMDFTGQQGVNPRRGKMITTDGLVAITTAGYLNEKTLSGNVMYPTDIIDVVYSYNPQTNEGTDAEFSVSISNGLISLAVGSGVEALPSANLFVGNAANVAQARAITGDIGITNTGVTSITAGSIVNADVNAAAAIAYSKLAALPSAQILVGSAGNVATAVAMSGDIAITNGGVTSIAAGAIVNADINAAAAIDFSKLAALASGNIIVGSAGTVPTSVAMSGDATIIASGALTIANNAITTAKILDANVTLGKLAAGITPSHIVKFAGQPTTVGGAAAEAFNIPGVLGTDLAFVQIVNDGTANVTVLQAVCTVDTLTVTFSANPGNDCVFNYQIIRAAA